MERAEDHAVMMQELGRVYGIMEATGGGRSKLTSTFGDMVNSIIGLGETASSAITHAVDWHARDGTREERILLKLYALGAIECICPPLYERVVGEFGSKDRMLEEMFGGAARDYGGISGLYARVKRERGM